MTVKGELTKQRILHEAYSLFSQKGYKDATVQELCERTGLSKGGLYRHYSNMDEIFLELLKQQQSETGDNILLQIEENAPASVILEELVQHMANDFTDGDGIALAMYEFFLSHKENVGRNFLTEQFERGKEKWIAFIEYGIDRGEFHCKDPEAAASCILFLSEGIRLCVEIMPVTDSIIKDYRKQILLMLEVYSD